jgi:hypothetical protein
MDDFVAYVDRRIAGGERTLNDIDCADNARTETARLRQDNFHAETPVLRCATTISAISCF